MRFPRGKSILRLVASGFLVVTAPLIIAAVLAVLQVERMAEQGRQAVLDAEIATQQSRAVIEHLTAMERSMGQFAILGDASLYQAYMERRTSFLLATGHLSRSDFTPSLRMQLRSLVEREAALHRQLSQNPERYDDLTRLTGAFAGLVDQARTIAAGIREVVQREADETRDAAATLQGTLLVLTATVIPVAVGLALIAIMLINRPLAAIKSAITRLGAGDFDSTITVSGPEDLRGLGDRLDWLRRRIVSLENDKTNFLRRVSHELKTPLSSIREGTELLDEAIGRRHAHTGETREIVGIIRDSSARLQELIEDLLQFGRSAASTNARTLSSGPVHLSETIGLAIGKHELALRAKDLHVSLHVPDISVRGDPVQLVTIMDNIISNAIRYSPPTGAIRVSAHREDDKAIVEVEDQGPGIAPEERQHVFEPFYQGHDTGTGRVKGTGLGLAIVKSFVEANGGTVEFLDSAVGARLRATLPIAAHG